MFFFFNDTATAEIYTLPLHDALPIWGPPAEWAKPSPSLWRETGPMLRSMALGSQVTSSGLLTSLPEAPDGGSRSWTTILPRSEEHTSELQSRQYLVCRLRLEKKTRLE